MTSSKELKKKYPWLIVRNRFTDKVDNEDEDFCELDFMPTGWKIAFGEDMCEEINTLLVKANYEEKYRISQIKEKYGELRWYDNGVPDDIYKDISDVIEKYTKKSRHTCGICGDKGEINYKDYYLFPMCDKCKQDVRERYE